MIVTQTGYSYHRNGLTFVAYQAFFPTGCSAVVINNWVAV